MNNRMSAAMPATPSQTLNPMNPIKDTSVHDHDFALPKLPRDHHQDLLHVPPRPTLTSSASLGWALHAGAGGAMGAPEGVGLALSDTPMASTPSTAPGSPRM